MSSLSSYRLAVTGLITALALLLTLGSGCVGDDDQHDHADHETHDDHDAGGDHDAHEREDADDDSVDEEPDQLDFTPASTRAATGEAQDGSKLWVLEALDDDVLLNLELYEAYGGPSSPGTVDITDEETSYATCATCVVLRTGCATAGDGFQCEKSFMPREGGEVRIDEIGSSEGDFLAGELLELTFQEVTISDDYRTEPVTDGDVLRLDAWAFDAELEIVEGGSDEVCSGHGHLHGDQCHCDPGYRLDPDDSTKCIPE
jgi:hypothetical protein